MSELKDYIEQHANMLGRMGGGVMERFVLRNGAAFTPIAHTLPMGKMKECFMNSANFVVDADLDAGYRYCEGYGLRKSLGMLIHHAWVLDANDNVIDLTWRDSEECLYYGVPFDLDTLTSELMLNGVYGLLDIGMYNIRLMNQIDPTTDEYIATLANKRKEWKDFEKSFAHD